MKNIWYITIKELKSYFASPIAYVVGAGVLLITGWFFFNILYMFTMQSLQMMRYPQYAQHMNLNDMVLRPVFLNMSIILLFLTPLLTMRLFAEEKKTGTIELLFTSPLRITEIVLGKYLAAFIVLAGIFALTLQYPETGPIITTYIGLLLLGGSFLAIGSFTSSVTENQIVAAVSAFAILMMFWVINWASGVAGETFGPVLSYLSIFEHMKDFTNGMVDTKDLVYYMSLIFLGLFLSQRALESKRWR
jgi:ABC-2 type transport system permease protein